MVKVSKKEGIDQPISTDVGMVFQYIFEETDRNALNRDAAITHTPVIDMFSTSDAIIIEVEMPGVRREEIDVSILQNTLTVRGIKYECFDEKKVNFACMERSFGKFFRTIDMPFPVDTGKIKSVYKNGLLTITLKKIEEKRGTPKKIIVDS